ncbi:hypothetical protein [Rhodococcus qingshengii]|uniref:Uncharacterized protein n=1 Tax=Rhodococcus qingshengii JCM 15477 TaxID=1303681 RepID=A0AB38RC89_RHOSG|nr:hypothetical protein [Rhodococcus qingshengii]UPU42747.1 hypothetical protein M0639_27590 [Rhodococcus qingshengii JCM 15477]
MKTRISRAVLVVTASLAVLIPVSASTASAAPTGCTTGGGNAYSTAYCSGGSGRYWAWANCKMTTWPYWTATVHGGSKAAKSGQHATVLCPPLYLVINRGVGVAN